MSLQLKYVSSVRKQLKRFATWDPGAPVRLGDYGVLRQRTFERLGHVDEFGIDPKQLGSIQSDPATFEFTTVGTTVAQAEASGRGSATPKLPSARASITVRFAADDSLFIRAHESRWIELAHVREVADALRKTNRWDFSWKIVAGLRTASSLSVLMGAEAGCSVKIEGSADALQQLNVGTLKTGTDVRVSGSAALKVIGAKGPFLLDLIRVRRFFGGATRNAAPIPTEPFEPVSPEDVTEDDI
jgi:hypothetical protein